MRYAYIGAACLALLSVPLLMNPPEGSACGPFLPEVQFGFIHDPGPEFLRGELGIIKPRYYRRNLIVAYRYLTGAPLSADEIQALLPGQPVQGPPPGRFQPGGPEPVAVWLDRRTVVPGAPKLERIEVYRYVMINGYYAAYRNCLDGAFLTAADTLQNRVSRWGRESANTAEWLKGQDQVFWNCPEDPQAASKQPHIPADLPAGGDPLLHADRQYQIAAALFYAGRYADAEERFRRIATDSQSPWRDSGLYLAARALIRRGTVDQDKDALGRSERALQQIIGDPKLSRWHEPARGLLDFVGWHLHAEDRMVEIGAALSRPGPGARFAEDLEDYTRIWDRLRKGPAERSELADWIASFQSASEPHALERWRAGGGTVWLIAALAAAQPGNAAAPELIAAAAGIHAPDPAYLTAVYHAVRLEIALKQEDDARRRADEVLGRKLPPDAENAFRAERLALARDWTEFLRYAARRPVAVGIPFAEAADQSTSGYANQVRAFGFDTDSTDALNRKVPLQLWAGATRHPLLPRELQGDVAQAGWVRAVLLDRPAEARTLARRVAELRPELAEGMRAYASARSPDAARFEAAFFMRRTPGLSPIVRDGIGRLTKTAQLDDFRDNWWRLRTPAGREQWVFPVREPKGDVPARFLTGAQRTEGEKEWDALVAKASTGPNYLCAEALAWARRNPRDPRIPEALHLAVRATRYGRTDPDTSAYSRKAFQLLHSRYPNTKWAKETKYWY